VLGSNLGRDTGYPGWRFLWLSSVLCNWQHCKITPISQKTLSSHFCRCFKNSLLLFMESERSLPCSLFQPFDSTLNQFTPARPSIPYFTKKHFNINILSTSMSPNNFFSSGVPTKILYNFLDSSWSNLLHTFSISCPSHSPWFHYPNNIWRRVKTTKLLIMQHSPASCYSLPPVQIQPFSSAPCSHDMILPES
jgi:hypothetical protein